MKENLGREMFGIGAGLAAAEVGPQAVKNAFGGMGFGLNEIPQIGGVLENSISAGQTLAAPVATLAILYAGFKTMLNCPGAKNKGKG